jgi:hypothetical protein
MRPCNEAFQVVRRQCLFRDDQERHRPHVDGAGVIGISGIYPQAIDAEWTQDSGTHLPKISLLTTGTTSEREA